MGCAADKSNPSVAKIYDNWVNRQTLGLPLDYKENARELLDATCLDGLLDFQKEDVLRMASHDFFLNRNKMGAGKTIEFIAVCKALRAESVMVIVLKPTITQWVAQFKRWWPERADSVVEYEFGYAPKRGDILIVNPEKVTAKKTVGMFNKFPWDVLCVDEAHIIKNRKSQRTQAIKSIPARRKYLLTGSPMLRNPDDLYSLFDFMSPRIAGGSYWNFTEFFCRITEDFFGRHPDGLTRNEEHVALLQSILDQCSCYNAVKVAQGKRKIVVPLEMSKAQKKQYNDIRKLLLNELPESVTIPNGAVRVIRLLQTTSCPAVLADEDNKKEPDFGVKFEYIRDMLEADPTLKIVVYSKFEQVISKLQQYLTKNKIRCTTYTGKQTGKEREANKKKFITQPKLQVLAGTIDALGTGVDGLQAVCHVAVFIDKDRRPVINEQCEDRLNRMGQEDEVLIYDLQCVKTVDATIDRVNTNRTADLRKLLEISPDAAN